MSHLIDAPYQSSVMSGKIIVIYGEGEDFLPDTTISRKDMIRKVTAKFIGKRGGPLIINHRNLFSVDANSERSIGRRGGILLGLLKRVDRRGPIVRLVVIQYTMNEKARKAAGLDADEYSVKYSAYFEVFPNDTVGSVYGDVKDMDLYKQGIVYILTPKSVGAFTKKVNETLKRDRYTFKQITTNIGKIGTHECSYIVNISDIQGFMKLQRDEITLAFTEGLRLTIDPLKWSSYYGSTKGDIITKVFNDRNFLVSDGTDILSTFSDEDIDELESIYHQFTNVVTE